MPSTTSDRNPVVRWLVGGLVAAGLITTGVVGGGLRTPEFNSAGSPSPTATVPAWEPLNAVVDGTGSTSNTLRYAATCIPNPLAGLSPSLGSGAIPYLSYQAGNNPAGVGGDIYFTDDCDDKTSTGSIAIIDDFCTSTGCVSEFFATTGSSKVWNGAHYIKTVFRANPTSSYTGRIRAGYYDIFGE